MRGSGRLLLHGEVKPVDEILARIEAVDLDDVHRVARLLVEEPPHWPSSAVRSRHVRRRGLAGGHVAESPADR